MTLKEKFKLPIDANNKINNYVAEQCEKIADEYAIEFAEWLELNNPKETGFNGKNIVYENKHQQLIRFKKKKDYETNSNTVFG